MSSASSRTFEDVRVGVRCKIAAWFLSTVESALLLLVARYAWTWPRERR